MWSFRVTVAFGFVFSMKKENFPEEFSLASPQISKGLVLLQSMANQNYRGPERKLQDHHRTSKSAQAVSRYYRKVVRKLTSQHSHHEASRSSSLPKAHGSWQPAELGTCLLTICHTEFRRPADCCFWCGRALTGLAQLPDRPMTSYPEPPGFPGGNCMESLTSPSADLGSCLVWTAKPKGGSQL